ncbi:MAG: hypothetical protein ACK40T_11710 [Akkermansiaceae bacterium]|jgi:hypothetical protein
MALQKALLPVGFNGLNQIIDEKTAPVGTYTKLDNVIIDTNHELKKRAGMDSIGVSTTPSNIYSMYSLGNELGVLTDTNLHTYSPTLDKFLNKGKTSSPIVTSESIIANTYTQTNVDSSLNSNGVQAFVWEDSRGGVRCSITDALSTTVIVSDYSLSATGVKPKVISTNLAIVFFYVESSTLKAVQYNINTGVFNAAVTVDTIINTNITYDVLDATVNTTIYPGIFIAAVTNTAKIKLYSWDIRNNALGTGLNGLIPPTEVQSSNVANATVISLAIDTTSTKLLITWQNDVDKIVRARAYTYLGAVFAVSETAISTATTDNAYSLTVSIDSSNNAYVILSTYATKHQTFHITLSNVFDISGITVSSAISRAYYHCGLVSKSFIYNNTVNYVISYNNSLQGTYFLVNFDGVVIARFFTQLAGGMPTKANSISKFSIDSTKTTNAFSIGLLRKTKILASSGTYTSTTSVFTEKVWFTPYTIDSKTVSRVLNIAGGFVKNYDGSNTIVEQGFHLYPELDSISEASGGTINAGQRLYKFVWEWTDNNGQIVRSQTSLPTTFTISNNHKVTAVVKSLPVTSKSTLNGNTRTAPVLAVYRTLVNGTTYYRVNQDPSEFVYNDPTLETISFLDNKTDTQISSNSVLYTTGGVFDNVATPSANLLTLMKNRIVIGGCDTDPNTIYVSKEKESGLSVEFSNELSIQIDSLGGNITALAGMDDKILIFKKSLIYYIAGQGPDKLGNGSFTIPQLVSSDTGTSNPQSIVLTSDGIMFQSPKGIYLIDRQLTVSYIGAPVKDYETQTITSAANLPDFNRVHFTMASGDGLVYHTFFKSWTSFSNLPGNASLASQSVWYVAGSKGVARASTTHYHDWDNEAIISTIKTAWISVAGLEGFQRVYSILLLGDNEVNVDRLKMNVYYDFRAFSGEQLSIQPALDITTYGSGTGTYGSEGPFGGSNDGTAQFVARPRQQKCSSIQIEIMDDFPQGFRTSGFIFADIILVVGTKYGYNKNLSPTARRFK